MKEQVISFILDNGGYDPMESNKFFLFDSYQSVISFRDVLREEVPQAFHDSEETDLGEPNLAAFATEYQVDDMFFRKK